MATQLEANVEQILFSNDPMVIAEKVNDLLLQVRKPEVFNAAVDLLNPTLDHWITDASSGALSAQTLCRGESL